MEGRFAKLQRYDMRASWFNVRCGSIPKNWDSCAMTRGSLEMPKLDLFGGFQLKRVIAG